MCMCNEGMVSSISSYLSVYLSIHPSIHLSIPSMIGIGMGGNHQVVLSFGPLLCPKVVCVCIYIYIYMYIYIHPHAHSKKQGFPQFTWWFRRYWWILGCIRMARDIILAIHVAGGWRDREAWSIQSTWSSLTAMFQQRRMQQLVVSCGDVAMS